MGGDQDPLLRGDFACPTGYIVMKFRKPFPVNIRALTVVFPAVRVELDQRTGNFIDGSGPQRHVEPDVRIEVPRIINAVQKLASGNILANGHRLLAAAHLLEDPFHLRLQIQTVVENDIGLGQLVDVTLRRFVQMRVHARAHQTPYLDAVAADFAGDIGDHTDG